MTADHQKVVHPQEDLPADQKAAVLAARVTIQVLLASSEDHATIQVPHVHHVQNHPTVFQENASHLMGKENRIKVEIASHSIVITAKVAESAVHSEIVNHLMGKENHTKVEENANHSIAITAKEAESVVLSEIVNHLMGKESPTKVEENANHSIAITAKVASANRTKEANVSLLAELKTQHVHPIKEIIAGIAMRPLR